MVSSACFLFYLFDFQQCFFSDFWNFSYASVLLLYDYDYLVLHVGLLITSILPTLFFILRKRSFVFVFVFPIISQWSGDGMHVCLTFIVDRRSDNGTVSCVCLSWFLMLCCVWIFRSVLEYGCWYHVSFWTRGSFCSWWWRWGIFHSSHTKMTLCFPLSHGGKLVD